MDEKAPHQDGAAADQVAAARALVDATKATLAELKRRIPGGLTPLESAEERRIEQAAFRLLECSEQLAKAELVVLGSTRQQRPHPLLKVEAELRREVTKSLRELVYQANGRATVERLNGLVTKRRAAKGDG